MSTQNPNLVEPDVPEWLDPFPEPQTIPNGWNLDSMLPAPAKRAAEEENEASDSQATHPGSSSILHV